MAEIYQVRLGGVTTVGARTLNVFGYIEPVLVLDGAHELATRFIAEIVPKCAQIVSGALSYDQVDVISMNNPSNFASVAINPPVAGGRTGEYMPLYVAAAFQWVRAIRKQRSGAKRFSPVAENDNFNGNVTAAYRALLDDSAAAFQAPIKIGLVDTWFPVILVRPPIPSGTWTTHSISGVIFRRLSTQNSRKG